MKITISLGIQQKIIRALKKAGSREIGGILMGEHVDSDNFRVVDLTIQYSNGTIVSFVRLLNSISNALRKFFNKTNRQYTRFNYLGEWHSHPSFVPIPSSTDIESMFEIVDDKEVGANFVILLIIRLNSSEFIEGSATAFFPDSRYNRCDLLMGNS